MIAAVGEIKDLVRQSYLDLLTQVATPPRLTYSDAELGPAAFDFGGGRVERCDFTCANERGHALACSLWRPAAPVGLAVYVPDLLDGRPTAADVLAPALAAGCALAAFDPTGCGASGGRHATLGFFERYDLACVVAALRERHGCAGLPVAVLGRGAGATAALLFCDAADHRASVESDRTPRLRDVALGVGGAAALDGATFASSRFYVVSKPALVAARVAAG